MVKRKRVLGHACMVYKCMKLTVRGYWALGSAGF